MGTGNKFKDVYIKTPPNNFLQEWMFTTRFPEYIDQENKWILFEKKDRVINNQKAIKKLRSSQQHKIDCRKVAEKLWSQNPEITIASLAVSDEITNVTGKVYAEKTIRDWIKDLCPNRKPGRRPKQK